MKEKVLDVQQTNLVEDEKTFNRNKWLFCTSGIGRDALYTLVSTYFLTYVQFGLKLTLAQYTVLTVLIGVVGRIWDGINDPMMGAIIEGSHFKWGKFKPWIFIGAVLDSLLTVVLFNVGREWSGPVLGWLYVAIICLVYLLWEAAFTMNDIGYWSMIPSLSRTKERRDQISTLTVFFAGIGTIFMTGLYTLFAQGQLLSAFTVFSIIACVMVIGMQSYTAFGVKEGPREDEAEVKKNEGEEKPKSDISLKKMVQTIFNNKQLLWISIAHLCNSCVTGILLGLIYNFYYLEKGYDGDAFYFVVIYALANTVLQLLYPAIAKKLKRKQIQLISYCVTAVGFVGMGLIGWWDFLPFNLVTLCVFGAFIFAGNTLFYTADIINFNNCVEYNEYITGERSEAVVTTMRPLIVKFADAVKYLTVTVVLAITGLYGLSQNISNMETQVNYFSNLSVVATEEEKAKGEFKTDASSYIIEFKQFKAEWELMDEEQQEDSEYLESYISDKYEHLSACQFDGTYTDVIGQLLVVEKDEDGNQKTIGDLDHVLLRQLDSDCTYSLSLNDGETNVANKNFKDEATIETRIGVRIAFCVVPLILQTLSLVLQRKHFIVDEEYYDQICKEIEERKQN